MNACLEQVPRAVASPLLIANWSLGIARNMTELELTIPTDAPLGATLLVPEDARAFVLLHQGGGVHDRDGNMNAVGFKSSLYRRVARMLAERGIASLRFDKRGHDRPAPWPHTYTCQHRIEDARAALSLLRSHAGSKPVFLVGHSEGGMVVGKLAESEEVAGVARLCSPLRSIFEVGRWRAQRLAQQTEVSQKAKGQQAVEYYARLEEYFKQGTRLTPEDFMVLGRRYPAVYAGWESFEWLAGHWADALNSEPRVRTLVVQGGRDARLTDDNIAQWQDWCAERPNTELHILEYLGHDLNDARQKLFRVDEGLMDLVAGWLTRR